MGYYYSMHSIHHIGSIMTTTINALNFKSAFVLLVFGIVEYTELL